MVDKQRRKKLAFHLRQLSVGQTTNDDFEYGIVEEMTDGWLPDQYYRSKNAVNDDAIIIPMLELCWGLYDGTRRHKLIGSDKLAPESLKAIAVCILFLHSDLKYEWPPIDTVPHFSLADLLMAVLTLGYSVKIKRGEMEKNYLKWQAAGDFNVWPFFSQADYKKQLEQLSFLSGVKNH